MRRHNMASENHTKFETTRHTIFHLTPDAVRELRHRKLNGFIRVDWGKQDCQTHISIVSRHKWFARHTIFHLTPDVVRKLRQKKLNGFLRVD
jgi:hypothetical protein